MYNTKTYKQQLEGVIARLTSHLSINIESNKYSKHPIQVFFERIKRFHKNKNIYERDINLLKLLFFEEQLERIKKNNSLMFNEFKRALKKAKTLENYYGIRFEVNIAGGIYMVDESADILKRESPDFELGEFREKVFIECTGCRISDESEKEDYLYKIRSAINNKINTEYLDADNNIDLTKISLFIDVSNLIMRRTVEGKSTSQSFIIDKKEYKDFVNNMNISIPFGNITLFSYLIDHTGKFPIHSKYMRIDMEEIHKELKLMLDKYFKIKDDYTHDFSVVNEG